jgi:hypothetical protein
MSIPLNPATLNLLLSHTGYGIGNLHPQKVEIVFIGNESGTAGKTTEEYIDRLMNPDKYKDEQNAPSPQRRSPMLQFMNRLRLYSNDFDSKWFLSKSNLKKEDYQRILNESCLEESVNGNTNIHLLDIRPLPRPTESSSLNYEELNRKFNSKLYLKAFNTFNEDVNNPYNDWVIQRKIHLIQKINQFSNLKYIFAAGHVGMKMSFLKELFPEILFDEKIGQSGKTFFTSSFVFNAKKIKVCASHFLSHRNGIGFNGLKDLAEMVFKKTD